MRVQKWHCDSVGSFVELGLSFSGFPVVIVIRIVINDYDRDCGFDPFFEGSFLSLYFKLINSMASRY